MEVMGLVYDHQIDVWPLAMRYRLDAAHLDRLIAISALMDALHDANAFDALGFECSDGLVDQAKRRNRESDALSFVQRTLDDVSSQQCLAEARRRLKHRRSVAC